MAAGAAAAARAARAARSSTRAPTTGAATKGDIAQLRARAAAGDQLVAQAYQAGQDATPWEDLVVDVREAPGARDAYDQGRAERRRARLSTPVDSGRRVAGVRGPGIVNDGAGFVLGLLLYALVLNYVQGGPGQARAWLAAKFINRTPGGGERGRGGRRLDDPKNVGKVSK